MQALYKLNRLSKLGHLPCVARSFDTNDGRPLQTRKPSSCEVITIFAFSKCLSSFCAKFWPYSHWREQEVLGRLAADRWWINRMWHNCVGDAELKIGGTPVFFKLSHRFYTVQAGSFEDGMCPFEAAKLTRPKNRILVLFSRLRRACFGTTHGERFCVICTEWLL